MTIPSKSQSPVSTTRVSSQRSAGNQPRILFVSHTAETVGPTNSLYVLVKPLSDRYDVSVLLPGSGAFFETLTQTGIPVIGVPTLDKTSIPGLVQIMRRNQYDLVYGNNTSGAIRNAFIAAKVARIPFICHVRGMGRTKSWRDLFYLRYSDAVIAVSEACAGAIAQYTRPDRLHVVHNGIRPQNGTDQADQVETLDAELGLRPDDTVVLSLAHLKPRKGQGYAVEAANVLIPDVPSLRLLLAGNLDRDAGYVEKIRTMIETAERDAHVSLLGFRSDVHRLLRRADVFVHTALADPHPRAVIEAMAAGVPVVAFAVDGVAETVVDGETGYLVPTGDTNALADAMRRLATDQSLRERLGENAKRRAEEHFSAERTTRQVAGIIDRVLTQ